MSTHTPELWSLAEALLAPAEFQQLQTLTAIVPLDYAALRAFDQSLGGPSMTWLLGHPGRENLDGIHALLHLDQLFSPSGDIEWNTRPIVSYSGLYLEALIKRIGGAPNLPLGQALHQAVVKALVDEPLHSQLTRFAKIYNAAKHDMPHPKDTHLFSPTDAVLAYIVSRQLGNRLYPHAGLKTDLAIFDKDCEE